VPRARAGGGGAWWRVARRRAHSFDALAAEAFAPVNAGAVKSGNRIAFADAAIAAIAKANGFAVATRNVRDFRGTGVALVDTLS
jgi:predicted nucleic acid-binding protein